MTNAEAIEKDLEVLREFVGLYCREHHGRREGDLCDDCRNLLDYAVERRRKCPLDPKPRCSKCEIHCYREPYRAKIREVMKFGGMHCLKHVRIAKLVKLALGLGGAKAEGAEHAGNELPAPGAEAPGEESTAAARRGRQDSTGGG